MTEFKAGDTVYDSVLWPELSGVVFECHDGDFGRLTVNVSDETVCYYFNTGSCRTGGKQTLFHKPYKFEPQFITE